MVTILLSRAQMDQGARAGLRFTMVAADRTERPVAIPASLVAALPAKVDGTS